LYRLLVVSHLSVSSDYLVSLNQKQIEIPRVTVFASFVHRHRFFKSSFLFAETFDP